MKVKYYSYSKLPKKCENVKNLPDIGNTTAVLEY